MADYTPSGITYYNTINTYANGERASATTLNRPVVQLSENVANLKTRIDSLQGLFDSRYELRIPVKKSGFNLDVASNADIANGSTAGKLARADDPRLTDKGAPAEHTHVVGDILTTGLEEGTYLYVSGGKIVSTFPKVAWANVLSKPTFFPTNTSSVSGLVELLSTYSSAGHSHGINDIRNLDLELTTLKNSVAAINLRENNFATKSHTHEISDLRATNYPTGQMLIVSGNSVSTMPIPSADSQLPAGGQNGQFVQKSGGVNIWSTVKISDVVNLTSSLAAKAALSHTHSVTDIVVPDTAKGKYLFVDFSGQVSFVNAPTGGSGTTPDEFVGNVEVNLASNGSSVTTLDIPSNRLYGVSVKTSGPVKNLQVELLGESTGDVQYLAVFTDSLTQDVAQAWRFRDRTATNKMRVRVTNKDSVSFSGSVQITAEPF